MDEVTYADFITDAMFAVFADVAKYPEAFATAVLAYTSLELKDCYWGQYYSRAIKLLTAHRLEKFAKQSLIPGVTATTTEIPEALRQWIDPSSIVTSLSASQGNNSVSFTPQKESESSKDFNHSGIGANEDLSSTLWGQMFLSIPQVSVNVGSVI